ncbi:MAG: nucleoside-diphosphate kinase [Candidatus Latescibacterota bacterium]|nr:MAG: nucleoside-diphosphate kinase [Candidatus Latescibacterota bacterium]
MRMEKTLLIVKPDATGRSLTGEILRRLEGAGFRLCAIRALRLRREEAESFYLVHRERPFYAELVAYMTSGPVVPMVLERENAVAALREFIGATNPADAKKGSIRSDLGLDVQRNAVHASDSIESARREIAFFFAERERL